MLIKLERYEFLKLDPKLQRELVQSVSNRTDKVGDLIDGYGYERKRCTLRIIKEFLLTNFLSQFPLCNSCFFFSSVIQTTDFSKILLVVYSLLSAFSFHLGYRRLRTGGSGPMRASRCQPVALV